MKESNILIVLPSISIKWWIEKSATTIWNELSMKWYNVFYLTTYKSLKLKHHIFWKEIAINFIKSTNVLVKIFSLLYIWYYIKKYSSLYNINTSISFWDNWNFYNTISKILWNKSKIIISIRTSINESVPRLNKVLLKYLYPKADFVVPIVKEERQNLIQNYWIKPKKIQSIYNMFDIKWIQKKSEENLWEYQYLFNNGKFTFINIWRLSKQKNQKLLLKAFDKFHQRNINTQLLILWDGELKDELKIQKQSLSSNKDIHFLWVHENPYKFLANSDIYVSSSSYEWMSRVLIEAMACWLPIVTTDHPTWAKEIIKKDIQDFRMVKRVSKEEYGILVPVDNQRYLTEAMQDLYNNKGLQRHYSQKSKKRAKEFNIDNLISDWEMIL